MIYALFLLVLKMQKTLCMSYDNLKNLNAYMEQTSRCYKQNKKKIN